MNIAYIDNFLSPEEVQKCLEFYEFIDSNNMWQPDEYDSFWDGRTYDFTFFMKEIGDKEQYKFFIKILKRMRDAIIKEFDLDRTIHPDTMQIVKWAEGKGQLPHADNCEQDGDKQHISPWRLYSGIIYLNDDYDGGQTYFPNFDYEIQPKTGRMGTFFADLEHTHGVRDIENGERKTIITFWCHDVINQILRLG